MAVLLITEPSGARLPRGNVTVLVRPARARLRRATMITSSGSTPSPARAGAPACAGGARCASHQSSAAPSVSPVDGEARRARAGPAAAGGASPRARRRPGTRAPSGGCAGRSAATSTSRGAARLTRSSRRRSGARRPAAWAIAGRWSRRLVEPPNAAWTSIAFSTAASVRMSRSGEPARLEATQRARRAPGHVEPDRLARRRQRACAGSDRPSASPTTCDGRRGAEELAAAARRAAGAAARCSAARSSVISPCAKRAPMDCTLPASSPSAGGQGHAARHEHAGQIAHARRAPSSSRAGPCRRWRRRARPPRRGSERISRRRTMRGVVAVGQAVHHPRRALGAAVAGVGDRSRRTAGHPRRAAPRPRPRISEPTSQWPVW